MAKKSDKSGISRRDFLKNVGGGVVGSSVLIKQLGAVETSDQKGDSSKSANRKLLKLTVNRKTVQAMIDPNLSLADFLRDHLNLSATKIVCNQGECGSCTVLLDDVAVYSCHMLAMDAMHKSVTTAEGLLDGEKLHPLQEAFVEHDGMQCGFCTPGQVMAAQALLIENPKPTREEVISGMSGNLCRCGAYPKIIDSVFAAGNNS